MKSSTDIDLMLRRRRMGAKDLREKHLFSKNDVFTSVWNDLDGDGSFQADGETRLDPNSLTEVSPEMVAIIKDSVLQRFRDVFKLCRDEFGLSVALFGLENQTEPELDMAIRVMVYDALGYYVQSQNCKNGGRIVPIFTRVLYFGYNRKWGSVCKLSDLCVIPPKFASRFQDYKVEVIELAWLSDEQIERLTGDLKVLAVFLRKMRLNQLDDWPDIEITYVPEVLDLLKEITGHKRFEQEKCNFTNLQRRINMCELFEKHDSALIEKGKTIGLEKGREEGKREGREEGKREGREEGKREGKKEGKAEMASAIARNLIAMRMSKEAVAKATGLSIDEVQALMAS